MFAVALLARDLAVKTTQCQGKTPRYIPIVMSELLSAPEQSPFAVTARDHKLVGDRAKLLEESVRSAVEHGHQTHERSGDRAASYRPHNSSRRVVLLGTATARDRDALIEHDTGRQVLGSWRPQVNRHVVHDFRGPRGHSPSRGDHGAYSGASRGRGSGIASRRALGSE